MTLPRPLTHHRIRLILWLVWAMTLTPTAPAAEIQSKAENVLRAWAEHYAGMKSFRVSAEMIMNLRAGEISQELTGNYTIGMQRPRRLAIVRKEGKLGATVICDGKKLLVHVPALSRYAVTEAPQSLDAIWQQPDMKAISAGPGNMVLIDSLVHSDPYESLASSSATITYAGEEKLNEEPCHRLKVTQEALDFELWLTREDKPVVRQVIADMSKVLAQAAGLQPGLGHMKMQITVRFGQWEVNPELPDRTFAIVPPQGAQRVRTLARMGPPPHPLVGKEAPAFELSRLEGGTVDLNKHLGKDVVMLDFWTTWCAPCVRALPILNRVAEDYKDKGVVFYAVNKAEDARTVDSFLKRRKIKLPVLLDRYGRVGANYQANSIPQTVLIGRDGRVQVVHVGFGPGLGQRLRAELDALLADKDLAGGVGQ